MEHKDLNLLDEALGLHNNNNLYGRFMLVEDCVDTSAAFVLHHILKRSLASHPSSAIVFLALSHPFSHYDRILRKLVFPLFLSISLCICIWCCYFFFLILHLVLLFYFNFKASLLTSLLLLLHSFMPFFINFRNWVSVVLIKMFDLCCFCLRVLVLLLFLFKCLVGFMLVLLYCSSF